MATLAAHPLDFPAAQPEGFPLIENDPVFDPARHLQIETPEHITTLSDMGYSDEEIAQCPTDLGITSTFRILSDEGAACLLDVARQLSAYTRSNPRISRMVRGGAYQSRFLRDLCLSQDVSDMISTLCKTPMLPHSIPHQLGHLNYNPHEVGENVDKWHTDTLRVDFVMFVTDPNLVEGGEFEFYNGTKHEVAALKKDGKPLDPAKVVAAALPGPGYAVLQQGNMVVHRAKGLRAAGERITMVNGYVAADTRFEDFCRFDQLQIVDPEHVVATEYARHMAWVGRETLDQQMAGFEFGTDRAGMAAKLDHVAGILANAATQLRDESKAEIQHFGDE